MDTRCFDRLVRSFAGAQSRRGLLGAFAAIPLIGDLAAAKKRKKKRKKKKCKPKPLSTTCAGKCGAVKNNCKKNVQCACPSGQCCGGSGTCGSCRVFVSSVAHTGAFDGLAGADAFCQDLAEAAGRPGEYLAWLSDSDDSPSTRFVQATVPYVLVDGATTVAANWGALISGTLAHAIDKAETGDPGGGQNVWTNTLANGTPGGIAANGHCEEWTTTSPVSQGNTGFSSVTTESWTRFSNHECGDPPRRLYCFQQR